MASFEHLRKKCLEARTLFTDPDFPADDSAIFFSRNPPYRLKWMRPYEICRSLGLEPKFISEGGSRFDLNQGELGDCWVLAAAASISRFPNMFARAVRPGQSFDKGWYAGIFCFQFWRYGEWVEVYVDDLLPTYNGQLVFVHSKEPNEFWGALLEKAYAKLHSSYEAIKGGNNADSLTDFTGGLVESYSMHDPPRDLPRLLNKASQRRSVMSASIYGDSINNPVRRNGLVTGHAYSVTGFTQVTKQNDGKLEYLVRIRNPWGSEVEWNGRWSDRSEEWRNLTAETRKAMGLVKDDDGEFWMELSDFVRNYDSIEICNLTADSLRDAPKSWSVSIAHSQWRRQTTAGGRPSVSSFYKNPQFHLSVKDHDEDDDRLASFVVEVMQKNRRRNHLPYLAIGFVVYAVPRGTQPPLDKAFLRRTQPQGSVDEYVNTRSVVQRFAMEPGDYVIIPTSWDADEEGEFVLRVFSESAHNSSELQPNTI